MQSRVRIKRRKIFLLNKRVEEKKREIVFRGEDMTDKNLFLYDLAVVAIFKNEGKYLKEWLDYHLLAGVEHFYLYNNDSSDEYAQVLAPYVEKNLVTLTNISGKGIQMPAYDDAIEKHRFECRYMAFIDLDEFIYPKTGQSISEVVDEIFSRKNDAAALGINWQCFGSNGEDKADYSRGVLERFTRRAPSDWFIILSKEIMIGNVLMKSIVNPRRVDCWWSPHYANYFRNLYSVNSNGVKTLHACSHPIAADKIVINHYHTKSREEYANKVSRGDAFFLINKRSMENFDKYNHNEEFDDGILKYRAARADNFSFESDADKIRRAEKALIEILTQRSPFDAPPDFFSDKLETFLTCRALAEKLGTKIGDRTAEEYALVWIYQTLVKDGVLTYADLQLLIEALPDILSRPFPLCKKIAQIFSIRILSAMRDAAKIYQTWKVFKNLRLLQRLLNAF